MRGDLYIGRGSKQRSLGRSIVADDYKVAVCGRDLALQRCSERLVFEVSLQDRLATLSCVRLVCHCLATQACHADAPLITAHRMNPSRAYSRDDPKSGSPRSATMCRLPELRREPGDNEDTSPDEGAPPRGSGSVAGSRHWVRCPRVARRPVNGGTWQVASGSEEVFD